MKHKIAYLAIATAIAASSSFVMAAPTVGTSSTQIQVKGSKGGNYGFTLTMEEEDVMYYDASTKTFISQKPGGVRGVVSLDLPTISGDEDSAAAFALKAALDTKNLSNNKLRYKQNGTFINQGVELTANVAGVELGTTPKAIDLAGWIGHDLDIDGDGKIDPISKEPVTVSLSQTGLYGAGIDDGDKLPDGNYEGHVDIEWTASFGS